MTTPNGAPEWASGQATPDVTMNEAIRRTEAGGNNYIVVDKDLSSPPGSCADGATYIVAATGSGLWTGFDNYLMTAVGANAASGWYARAPKEGLTAYLQDENLDYLNGGTTWAIKPTGSGSIADDSVTNAKLRDSAALSVIGRSANSSGDPADIAASNDGEVLRRSGTSLGFGTVATAGIANSAVTLAKIANIADQTILGNNTGGSAAPVALTGAQAGAVIRPKESMGFAVSDETTALTTGTAKLTFRMPYAFTLSEVRASVTTAPTGSTLIVDINETGATILSTKLSIDASEKTSTTAASAAVISDTALADDAEITVDIDQIGSTIAGAGLKIWLIGTRT